MARNFKELEAKMPPESLARSNAKAQRAIKSIERRGDPQYRVHAGEVLREEFLNFLDMSVSDLAEKSGISETVLNDIVAEKQPVTSEIAASLGRVFDTSAEFWMNLQNSYDSRN